MPLVTDRPEIQSPRRATAAGAGLRVDTIVRLRWLAIAGQAAGVLFVEFALGFPTPLASAGAVILFATALNVALSTGFPRSTRLSGPVSALVLAFDVLQLSALLYLTGGLENPFSFLFLAPVMVSAAALPPRLTVTLGLFAVACASVLAVWHRPLPWFPGQALVVPGVYVAGVWVSILLGLAFIGVYAWRAAEEARQLSDALAATELALAREQHLHAVDGLAAAAAHQLGTPLSTIALVARELERQATGDHPFREDIALLRSEAARCRDILGKITSLGGEETGPHGTLSIGHLLEELAAAHRVIGATIDIVTDGTDPQPVLARNPGILHGLDNIIENAADFADDLVVISARWDAARLTVTVSDDGPGFPSDLLERIGEPYVSRRALPSETREGGGLGLGLFIARTLLERSGAQVRWGNRPGRTGAEVTVTWPRANPGGEIGRLLDGQAESFKSLRFRALD